MKKTMPRTVTCPLCGFEMILEDKAFYICESDCSELWPNEERFDLERNMKRRGNSG